MGSPEAASSNGEEAGGELAAAEGFDGPSEGTGLPKPATVSAPFAPAAGGSSACGPSNSRTGFSSRTGTEGRSLVRVLGRTEEGLHPFLVAGRYAVVLPGRTSIFRAGLRPYSNRENLKIGPPAGRPILMLPPTKIWPKSGHETRSPLWKHYCVGNIQQLNFERNSIPPRLGARRKNKMPEIKFCGAAMIQATIIFAMRRPNKRQLGARSKKFTRQEVYAIKIA
jgi:hypothetical protein